MSRTASPGLATRAGLGVALRRIGRWRVGRRLARHRSFVVGAGLFALVVAVAPGAPVLAPPAPDRMQFRLRFSPPGPGLPCGTDNFGRDLLSRVVYGARLSLEIGFAVMVMSGFAGALIGATAGYFRRLDDGL